MVTLTNNYCSHIARLNKINGLTIDFPNLHCLYANVWKIHTFNWNEGAVMSQNVKLFARSYSYSSYNVIRQLGLPGLVDIMKIQIGQTILDI